MLRTRREPSSAFLLCRFFTREREFFYQEFTLLLLLLVYVITLIHDFLVAEIFSSRFHNSSMTWKACRTRTRTRGTFHCCWLLFRLCFYRPNSREFLLLFVFVFFRFFFGLRTALQKWTKLNELSSFLPKMNRPHRIQIENYTASLFISRRRQTFLVLKLDFRSNANFAVFFLCTANLCYGKFASKKSPQTFDNCTSKKREEKVWQTEREIFSSAIKKSSFIQPRATFRLITK